MRFLGSHSSCQIGVCDPSTTTLQSSLPTRSLARVITAARGRKQLQCSQFPTYLQRLITTLDTTTWIEDDFAILVSLCASFVQAPVPPFSSRFALSCNHISSFSSKECPLLSIIYVASILPYRPSTAAKRASAETLLVENPVLHQNTPHNLAQE